MSVGVLYEELEGVVGTDLGAFDDGDVVLVDGFENLVGVACEFEGDVVGAFGALVGWCGVAGGAGGVVFEDDVDHHVAELEPASGEGEGGAVDLLHAEEAAVEAAGGVEVGNDEGEVV